MLKKEIWKYVMIGGIKLHEAEKQLIKLKKKRNKRTAFRIIFFETDLFFSIERDIIRKQTIYQKSSDWDHKKSTSNIKKKMNKNLLSSFSSPTFISKKKSSFIKKRRLSFFIILISWQTKIVFDSSTHFSSDNSLSQFVESSFFQTYSNSLNLFFWKKILSPEQYSTHWKTSPIHNSSKEKTVESNLNMNVLASRKQWITKKRNTKYQKLLKKELKLFFSSIKNSNVNSLLNVFLNSKRLNSFEISNRFSISHFFSKSSSFTIIISIVIAFQSTSEGVKVESKTKSIKKRRLRRFLKIIKVENEKKPTKKKDEAIDKIVKLIETLIFMIAEHDAPVLQKAWNAMIQKINDILSELKWNHFLFFFWKGEMLRNFLWKFLTTKKKTRKRNRCI